MRNSRIACRRISVSCGRPCRGDLCGWRCAAWKHPSSSAHCSLGPLHLQAVKAGFCGIDTACQPKHYRQDLVGQALQQLEAEGIPRSALFIQTKYTPFRGQDPNNIPYDPRAPLEAQVSAYT